MRSRWLRWLGPGVIALGALGSLASTAIGAGERPWTPRACPDESGERIATARSSVPVSLGDLRQQAWFRVDPRLDRAGALEGQRVLLGTNGDRASRVMDLPPESFAAGPFGRIVLVGSDDGTASRLEAVNVADGCSWLVGEESAVIRRATIDPVGTTVYEMRVDRATRADLGIWTRPLDGSMPSVRVLDPIGVDERFGRTYATEFVWDIRGHALAVQSCGEAACRTRVIDPAGGEPRLVAEPDLGALVGLDGQVMVTYAACPGLPCPILATDIATGARSVLADAGAGAVVVSVPDGTRLVHEAFGESGLTLRAVNLDGSSANDLGGLPEGVRLQSSQNVHQAATRIPPGWIVLSPERRLPGVPNAQIKLRHVPDGTTVPLEEVVR